MFQHRRRNTGTDIGLQSVHYFSSDGSGGLAAHGADHMDFEGEGNVGVTLG